MGMIRYAYDPIYKTFINTPRNPDDFVSRTIREVTQQLFGRQFNLVRVKWQRQEEQKSLIF